MHWVLKPAEKLDSHYSVFGLLLFAPKKENPMVT
jgi:hypothetical protein